MAMSQFDSLVLLWHDVFANHLDHRDECVKIATQLRDLISLRWKWPEDLMAVYRLDVMPYGKVERKDLIREAMKVDEDEFFVFGLELSTPSRYSHDPAVKCSCIILKIMFPIGIKKTGNSFAVRIIRAGNPLPANSEDDIAVIVDLILDGLKYEMEKAYPAEGEQEVNREFGFAQGRPQARSGAPQ